MQDKLFAFMYLAVNVAVLVLLIRLKYYRTWRMFTTMQAATCLQIAVRMAVPVADRHAAVLYWLPTEGVLILATLAAVLEILWRSMRGFEATYKWGVCGSLLAAMFFCSHAASRVLGLPHYADWFQELVRVDRVLFNLALATLSNLALGIAGTANRRNCPRFVQLHTLLLTILCAGHVWLADWSTWKISHELFRGLELSCLLGWLINASLLRDEDHYERRVAKRDVPPTAPSFAPAQASRLPSVSGAPPAWTCDPANRRRPVAVPYDWPAPHGRTR